MIVNNLLKAASFKPDLLDAPSAWLGHLPFAAWVMVEVRPKIFVELGSHFGHSYFSFCQAVLENNGESRCYAVDTWRGDEHAGEYNENIYSRVNEYNQRHYADFSKLLRMNFDEAVGYFANESIELIHIDGLHTYEAVKHDFETWLPKLAPGAIIIFHDTNVRERNFGVWKLWDELKKLHPNNIEFFHSHGLGVLQLNNYSDENKANWIPAEVSMRQDFLRYFASLGSHQYELSEFQALKKSFSQKNQLISELQALADRQVEEIIVNKNSIEYFEREILDFKVRLKELQEQLEASHDDLRATRLQLEETQRQLELSQKENRVLDRNIAESEIMLREIRDSTSWRLTAPLRKASSLLK